MTTDEEARTLSTLREMRERYPRSSFSLIDMLLQIADDRDRLAALSTPPADDVREALTETARDSLDRIGGWKHLRKYSGMSSEWMDVLRDAIICRVSDALAEVRPRVTVTDGGEQYEFAVLNGLGTTIYRAPTLGEAQDAVARDQRVGPDERVPKRSIIRRRRAGKWEAVS